MDEMTDDSEKSMAWILYATNRLQCANSLSSWLIYYLSIVEYGLWGELTNYPESGILEVRCV